LKKKELTVVAVADCGGRRQVAVADCDGRRQWLTMAGSSN